MAGEDRRDAAGLNRRTAEQLVAETPHDFDPFQALRVLLLDRAPGRGGIGEDTAPSAEAVRLSAAVSHNFAASTLQSVTPPTEDERGAHALKVAVNFMGAFGPMGVLPRQHTDLLARTPSDAKALRAFLDLFNHRVVSHFYRAWRKYRMPVEYERSRLDHAVERDDPFTTAYQSLVGLGLPSLRGRLSFSNEAIVWFAGHFSRRVPGAQALRQMLRECVDSGVDVEQLRGVWCELADNDRTSLGARGGGGLGMGQVLGKRVWIVESRFRIRLGPLSLDQFRRFCPGGQSLTPMAEFVRAYVGPVLDYDVQPVLKAADAPRPRLTREPERRLGVDTWLITMTPDHDLDDAVFRPSGWPERSKESPRAHARQAG